MLQPHNRSPFTSPSITAGDVKLPVVDKSCYIGCILTSDVKADEDMIHQLTHSESQGCIRQARNRLWDEHGIRLDTKISVYVAVVLTILLYAVKHGLSIATI